MFLKTNIKMKTLLIIYVLMLISLSGVLYSQSNITYDAGSTITIDISADVCADNIIINGSYSGGGTICNGALPVIIASFTYSVNKNNVLLNWVTSSEINNAGFAIERKEIISAGSWVNISFIPGHGTTSQSSNYYYEDKKLKTGSYQYRLKQMDYNGNYEYFSLHNNVNISKPAVYSISQNYPNPSNPKSKIDFEIPEESKVTIKLYNLLGQEVSTILNEQKEAGYYSIEFDGSNISSGVYFYRIDTNGFSKVNKMIILK
jgi:hypothetical protein